MGGRLGEFLSQWTESTVSPFVHDLIENGYRLEFSAPPPPIFLVTQPPRDREKAEALGLLLGDLLDQRVLSEVPQEEEGQGVYSHVFVVKKPSGKYRLILNLRPLNKWVRYKRFRMESIFSVTSLIFPKCYMATVDLRDAYLHIPIRQECQKFLRLAVRLGSATKHLQFRALPFGLSSSPRIFTKVLAEALAPLRLQGVTIVPYLDDLLFIAPSGHQLESDLKVALSFLRSLGWLVNEEKSQMIPSQEVMYLGYRITSVEKKIFLPQEKILKLEQAVALLQTNQEISIRQVMRVLGLMSACFPAVPWARFHIRPLQGLVLKHWNGRKEGLDLPMPIPNRIKRDL